MNCCQAYLNSPETRPLPRGVSRNLLPLPAGVILQQCKGDHGGLPPTHVQVQTSFISCRIKEDLSDSSEEGARFMDCLRAILARAGDDGIQLLGMDVIPMDQKDPEMATMVREATEAKMKKETVFPVAPYDRDVEEKSNRLLAVITGIKKL